MSPALVFFALFIFLVYIFLSPKRIEKFTNSQQVAAKVDNVFKKNFDLDYLDAKEDGNISELSKILSNRIAPIMDSSKGRKPKGIASVPAVSKKLTNRVPDKRSNEKEYKIPMPKFDDLQKGLIKPLMKSFKELNEMKDIAREYREKAEMTSYDSVRKSLLRKADDWEEKAVKKELEGIPEDNANVPVDSDPIISQDEIDSKVEMLFMYYIVNIVKNQDQAINEIYNITEQSLFSIYPALPNGAANIPSM